MTRTKQKDLPTEVRNRIAQFLLINSSSEFVAHHGKTKEAASLFGVSDRTIKRVWKAAREQQLQGNAINLISNKIGKEHAKRTEFDVDKFSRIPFSKRSTIRRVAHEMHLSKSNVGRLIKKGEIKAHTNAIKPELTPKNKISRLNFSLHHIQKVPENDAFEFKYMFNTVHIDEKWFYMSREVERYYILPGEEEPHRSCQSKRFITKVMFMCAVDRPRFSSEGEVIFDGKIGIWPFTERVKAQRNSKNRIRGTLLTKQIDSITKEVTKTCILEKVIPAIKEKWPEGASKNIIIQQDNAKPHIKDDDPDFRNAATSDGFNIQLLCQPPNSPDTNINDLGWFRAIQSLQVEIASYNVDDLVGNVLRSYQNLSPTTLNKVFISLQACFTKIIECKGHNNYKLPHLGKEALAREGRLPLTLGVDKELIKGSIEALMESGQMGVLPYDISNLVELLT